VFQGGFAARCFPLRECEMGKPRHYGARGRKLCTSKKVAGLSPTQLGIQPEYRALTRIRLKTYPASFQAKRAVPTGG
jgi:hypothetical protein